jgi:N-hydroxyarylamine O-acetyltransferase
MARWAAEKSAIVRDMAFTPDLSLYFRRVAYRGPCEPNLRSLNAIILAHVQSIPFENLDVLLGRDIDLDPAAVERKLLAAGRGGYCFEQHTLLLHVLEALGYKVKAIGARVRHLRPRDFVPPRTHVFLRVELDGSSWLVDVGVGGLSPTAALRLVPDITQETPHEPRRILCDGNWQGFDLRAPDARLFHQIYYQEAWHDVCEFTLEEMPLIDRELGNWFTSAHPKSHFKDRLMVARATPQGRKSLLNREFTVRDAMGRAEVRTLETPDELLETLASEFDLVLPRGTQFSCSGLDWSAQL